jgi:hypothetical protein
MNDTDHQFSNDTTQKVYCSMKFFLIRITITKGIVNNKCICLYIYIYIYIYSQVFIKICINKHVYLMGIYIYIYVYIYI